MGTVQLVHIIPFYSPVHNFRNGSFVVMFTQWIAFDFCATFPNLMKVEIGYSIFSVKRRELNGDDSGSEIE